MTVAAVAMTTPAVVPAAAQARTGTMTSFDGTRIVFDVYPAPGLATGQTASTVLNAVRSSRSVDGCGKASRLRVKRFDR